MASVHRENRNGKVFYRVQFYDKDRRRRSIRLGRISRKGADTIRSHVDCLESASISGGTLDGRTSRWLREIGTDLAEKLARVGLIEHRATSTMAAFIDAYIESRGDAKPNTIRNLKNTRKKLVDYFGEEAHWRDIKPGDADDWRQSLVNAKLSEATISKAVKHSKQYGRLAERKGLCESNPFAELVSGSERNESRLHFVDKATIDKVIYAAPNAEWRLIIALARYGGLRTPSETLALKWTDVDWESERLTVPSPKTERCGKGYRIIPLFPELRPYLTEVWETTKQGSSHIITRYRVQNTNLRTHFLRIIRRAGVQPWERLFHNLRASRQTELENSFPSHVVADWLGNSMSIARRHYLTTTEDHFRAAVQESSGATGGAEVVQMSVPQNAAATRIKKQKTPQPIEGCDVMRVGAEEGFALQFTGVPPRGVEPLSSD